jgi:hypothetical protein
MARMTGRSPTVIPLLFFLNVLESNDMNSPNIHNRKHRFIDPSQILIEYGQTDVIYFIIGECYKIWEYFRKRAAEERYAARQFPEEKRK